jgi:hypothetical protein
MSLVADEVINDSFMYTKALLIGIEKKFPSVTAPVKV